MKYNDFITKNCLILDTKEIQKSECLLKYSKLVYDYDEDMEFEVISEVETVLVV